MSTRQLVWCILIVLWALPVIATGVINRTYKQRCLEYGGVPETHFFDDNKCEFPKG